MQVFENQHNVTYCGKCKDGFIQTKLETGEPVLTPCECKVEQDKKYLYDELLAQSRVPKLSYKGRTYENYKDWLHNLRKDPVSAGQYAALYAACLEPTQSKFIAPYDFIDWVFSSNPREGDLNVLISNMQGKKSYYDFIVNFFAHTFVRRLIPVRVIPYLELSGIVSDYSKFSYEEFVKDIDVLFITDFFSDELYKSLATDFKTDRIFKFLFRVLADTSVRVVAVSDKPLGTMTDPSKVEIITKNKDGKGARTELSRDKLSMGRIKSLATLLLNNCKCLVFNVGELNHPDE